MSVDTLDTDSVRSGDCVRSDLEAQDDLPSTQPLSQSTERESSQGQETGGEKLPANLNHLDKSLFPFMKTNLSKLSEVRLALLAFMMSAPWENSLSTAAELGMAVLNKRIYPGGTGKGGKHCLFLCFSEHQLSSSFPILLERWVELVSSIAIGPGLL
ncbi:hypothetical protein GWK47_030655 [Chionoecetes opilio]|uniref:Uncharacterized protein n=1 Tax=Chionoecetes opilio TaxID=41210 RepID=A0A8J4YLG6_CHIOP|nr:hypothetical protein GWK47_030655 [Chionoecetes opilio]